MSHLLIRQAGIRGSDAVIYLIVMSKVIHIMLMHMIPHHVLRYEPFDAAYIFQPLRSDPSLFCPRHVKAVSSPSCAMPRLALTGLCAQTLFPAPR